MEYHQPLQPRTQTDDEQEERRTQEKTFKCMFKSCDKIFGFKRALEIHQRSVGHGKNKLECQYDNCAASFADPRSLSRHIRVVHLDEKPISCLEPGCGQKFTFKHVLQRHLCNAHGAPKLACKHDSCPASFVDQSSLSQHIRSVHLKDKPFSCLEQGCGKKFGTKRDLKKHTRFVHLKEKPFSCMEQGCEKKFANKRNLMIHTNSVHPKEGSDKTGCSKDFFSKQSQNILLAGETFKCKLSVCEKKVGYKGDLEIFQCPSRQGKQEVLNRGSAVTFGWEWPGQRHSRVPDPQEGVEEVAGDNEEATLQVHHLSCHSVTAPRNAPATSTHPAAINVLPKEASAENEGMGLSDVNMNNNSIKIFRCPEPGCQFKTEYQGNMVRHKKNKHELSVSPLHTSTPMVKRGRSNGGEVAEEEGSVRGRTKKTRTDQGFYCFNCLISFSNLEQLNMHVQVCCGRREDKEPKEDKLKRLQLVAKKMEVGDIKSLAGKKEDGGGEVISATVELEGSVSSSGDHQLSAQSQEITSQAQQNKKFVCTICSKAYLYARGLQRHQKFCKKGQYDESRSSDEDESEYEEEVDENVATCQECEMSFASEAGLAVHRQHCNKKVVYDEVGADGQGKIEEGISSSIGVGAVGKVIRSLPLLTQGNCECSKCGKTFMSNTALSLHKRFFGENCNKTAREKKANRDEKGEKKDSDSVQSGVGTKEIGLDNSCLAEKRRTVASAEEETQKTAGEGSGKKENDSEAVNKVEAGKNIKVKEEEGPVTSTRDCPRETGEGKVKMLVDYLSTDGKPFRINLTLPRDCIMQKVLTKIAENFKTGLDQLSFSRKGIELTGDEKAVDYEGEVVVVRPK